MFTGIIETVGKVQAIHREGSNYRITVASFLAPQLKIDQSVAHNGVCLTVVACDADTHTVVAIDETMQRTHLSDWQLGDAVNLERAALIGHRLDGHLVQGHVDTVGICTDIKALDGSWHFTFSYPSENAALLINKGSVCVNGVSLTVIAPTMSHFSVAIIPYTYSHTTFQALKIGSRVNLEFDILGKYLLRHREIYS